MKKPKSKMDKARAEFEKVWGMDLEPRMIKMGLTWNDRLELKTVLWKHWNASKK